jgi:hypothetical protein
MQVAVPVAAARQNSRPLASRIRSSTGDPSAAVAENAPMIKRVESIQSWVSVSKDGELKLLPTTPLAVLEVRLKAP